MSTLQEILDGMVADNRRWEAKWQARIDELEAENRRLAAGGTIARHEGGPAPETLAAVDAEGDPLVVGATYWSPDGLGGGWVGEALDEVIDEGLGAAITHPEGGSVNLDHDQCAELVRLPAVAPWYTLALQEEGVKEKPGDETSAEIAGYWETLGGQPEWFRQADGSVNDEVDWCGTGSGAMLKRAGYEPPNQPWASKHWRDWGIELAEPVEGCFVIFAWDENSGHVGMYAGPGTKPDNLYVYGGNQSDEWRRSLYKSRGVVRYCWPEGAPLPPGARVKPPTH